MLVLSNTTWILKVSSVINNYIKYIERTRKNDYARYIYPALYGKEYTEPVQLSIEDSDNTELDSSSDTLDTSNEYGRTSGRFKTGNPYRFQKTSKQDDERQMTFGSDTMPDEDVGD